MSETTTDLSTYELEDRLIDSLKSRDGVATAGDVASDTGLPYEQVEEGLDRMLKRYKSHLDVDDEGHLRYRFDPSFIERGEQPGRWWHETKKIAWKAFVWFFKVWTMVMLVGYTITFVLLLVALSVAALSAGRDEHGGGGGNLVILPFYLLARMLELLFWIDLFSYGGLGRRAQRMRRNRDIEKPSEPFYQKMFNYLFGPEAESASDPLATQKSFTSFVRHRDGRVTAAEWASKSGQSLEEADNALTAGIMRFQGDVDITDEGSLVYHFDQLQVTADSQETSESDPPPIWRREISLPPLTGNATSTNYWISGLNAFNLLMSSVVVFGLPTLEFGLRVGLGYVPLIFSACVFALPLLRKARRAWRQTTVERENRRRKALGTVFKSAEDGEARTLEARELPEEFADELVVDYEGDMEVTDDGSIEYAFPEIAQQFHAAREARRRAGEDEVVFGETIFSSDEEEKSLEASEMDDFDERLARELGEDVTLGDLEESVTESTSASEYVQVK